MVVVPLSPVEGHTQTQRRDGCDLDSLGSAEAPYDDDDADDDEPKLEGPSQRCRGVAGAWGTSK